MVYPELESAALNTSTSMTDVDLQEDVIAGLKDLGYTQRAAETAVRSAFRPGQSFEELFRAALAGVAYARSNGRPAPSNNQSSAATSVNPGPNPKAEPRKRRAAAATPVRTSGGSKHGDASAPHAEEPGSTPRPPLQPQRRESHVEKICGREGCGKKLQEGNESGFCTAHFYDSRRKSDASAPGPRRTTRKPARTKAPRRVVHAAVTPEPEPQPPRPSFALSPAMRQENLMQISEYEIDLLWERLPLNSKVALMFGRREGAA